MNGNYCRNQTDNKMCLLCLSLPERAIVHCTLVTGVGLEVNQITSRALCD